MDDLDPNRMHTGTTHPMVEAMGFLDHGAALFDKTDRLVMANELFWRALSDGQCDESLEQSLGEILQAAAPEQHLDPVQERIADNRMRGHTGLVKELVLPDRDGASLELRLVLHSDGFLTLLTNRRTKDVQSSAREIFGNAIDKVNFGVALIDEENRLLFANRKFRANCDPNDELLTEGNTMRQVHADAIRTGLFPLPEGWTDTDLLDLMDTLIETNARDFPVPNNHQSALVGNVYETEMGGRVLTIQDLTEERQAEKLMVGAMERLPVGIAIENAEGQFTHCNAAFAAPYDLNAADLLAMTSTERIGFLAPKLASIRNEPVHDDAGHAFRDAIIEQRETLEPFEVNFKTGQHFLVERAATENDGRVVVVTDITALKDAETRNLAAVTDAVQSLDIGVVLLDKDLRITFGNDKWREIFASDLAPPRLGDKAQIALQRQLEAGMYRLPEGITRDNFSESLVTQIANYAKDVPFEFANGRFVLASCHKTRLDGYLISVVDITEQRQIEQELQRQREIAQQKEKLSALGELLAGVAHELNNPLSIIVGYTQMLEEQVTDPLLQRRVDRISEAANRSAKIVQMFLAMARQRPLQKAPFSLNEIVDTAVEVAGEGLSLDNQLSVSFQDDLPDIYGDADQLIQVVYNIIINAQHAIQGLNGLGGLWVRTYLDGANEEAVAEFADNGPGVPNALRNRIFEPLFSTKETGEGTGVGLALCHKIINSHDGTITVGESEHGGALFAIRLPIAGPDAVPDTKPAEGEAT